LKDVLVLNDIQVVVLNSYPFWPKPCQALTVKAQ
jgi:hypothetical protein